MSSALFDINCLFSGMTPTNVQSAGIPVKRKKLYGKSILEVIAPRQSEKIWGAVADNVQFYTYERYREEEELYYRVKISSVQRALIEDT